MLLYMTIGNMQNELVEAVPTLLKMASEMTINKISDNCKFILTEIKNTNKHIEEEQHEKIKRISRKTPVLIDEVMPALSKLFDDIYDVNLQIFKSTGELTIIEIRYYLKTSLDADYRRKVIDKAPMLHCQLVWPPWISNKNEKFDINWQHDKDRIW